MDISQNGELYIEKGTRLKSIIRKCDFVLATPEEQADPNGPGNRVEGIPDETVLAVRIHKLGLSSKESVTNLWICFGLFDDSEDLKVQTDDLDLVNNTIIEYVYPRTFTNDKPWNTLDDKADWLDLTLDHIHLPQDVIDKYDSILGIVK